MENNYSLRPFTAADTPALMRLFSQSVHMLAAGQYTPAQLNAWAPPGVEKDSEALTVWAKALGASHTLVAADETGTPVGFGNLVCGAEANKAELDRLYVAPAAAGRGVGTLLTAALEAEAARKGCTHIYTYASRVAKPFFAARGWRLVRPNLVPRHGQTLQNFVMEKQLDAQ